MPQPPENTKEFSALLNVVESLRGPDGCPWDKEQTHQSLTPYVIEECFEMVEAIENKDEDNLIEELGDVLFQVILHSEIARQEKRFDISDVIERVSTKMITRHPHVFANTNATTAEEALESFYKVKAKEKANSAKSKPLFDIPVNLPALMRAKKIGSKTAKMKFDWPTWEPVLEKVNEELAELKEELSTDPKNKTRVQDELGDLLFSVAQLARHLDIEPEQALRGSNKKFEHRFKKMQDLAKNQDLKFEELNQNELESLWRQVKSLEPK